MIEQFHCWYISGKKIKNTNLKRYMHHNVHRSTIYNRQINKLQYVGVCVCGMCACLYMYNIFKNTKIKPAKNIIQLFCFCNLCELQPEEVQPTEVRPSDSPVYTCVTVGKSLKPLSSYVLTCSLFCFFFKFLPSRYILQKLYRKRLQI